MIKYIDIFTKEFLEQEYIINKKTQNQIAKIVNCNRRTVSVYLKKYNIPSYLMGDRKGKLASNYIDGRTLLKYFCIDCKKEISWFTAFYGNKRCRSCATKEQVKNPKNNPAYIDGRSFEDYPREFTQQLRDFIRTRDNFACQNCGMTEEEHLIINNQVLHVHHIDYNKQNCNKSNLITVCIRCNSNANIDRDYWFAYFRYIMEVIKCLYVGNVIEI